MQGNDISNVLEEGRTLVHCRIFSWPAPHILTGILGPREISWSPEIDPTLLAAVERTCRVLPKPTLVSTDADSGYLELLFEMLSAGHTHPFRSHYCYASDLDLSRRIPWMPNTFILDTPDRAALWGSRYREVML